MSDEKIKHFIFSNEITPNSDFLNRSEIAQEFIDERLSFIERWAIYIFLFILVALFGLGYFVRYPETVETTTTITSVNGNNDLITRHEGRITKLFFKNGDSVKKGNIIGFIESTGNHNDILLLAKNINAGIKYLQKGEMSNIGNVFTQRYEDLGEIQGRYQSFVTAWQKYRDFNLNGFYMRKKNKLLRDLQSLDNAEKNIKDEKIFLDEDLKLAKESYEMNRKLLQEGVLTKEEFRMQTSRYLNKKTTEPRVTNQLLDNDNLKQNKKLELEQLEHDIDEEKILFFEAAQSLKSDINDWIKSFVLIVPSNGQLYFYNAFHENQFVNTNTKIASVTPEQSLIYGETVLTQINLGKIKIGRPVQLRLDAYPFERNGFVRGTINYVSSIPSDSGYRATIKLSNGLITTEKFRIPYKSGLKAKTIIITDNISLAERLYYSIKKSASVGK